jgi:hypothetical protein
MVVRNQERFREMMAQAEVSPEAMRGRLDRIETFAHPCCASLGAGERRSLPLGDPVVVCQVRSTFRASVHPLPLLIVGCVLPEDHEGEWPIPVRQESGFQRHSRR